MYNKVTDIPRYQEVLEWATIAHGDQKRKFLGTPYINHPIEVASIAFNYMKDIVSPEELTSIVHAALCHDVVEDCEGYTNEQVRDLCGDRTAEIVERLTDPVPEDKMDRDKRKVINSENLKGGDLASKTIKCSDCLHNLRDMLISDEGFSRKYAVEKEYILIEALYDALPKARGDLNNTIQSIFFFHQVTESSKTLLREGKYIHPVDAIEEVRKPRFSDKDSYTWQNHISKIIRDVWFDLSFDARILAMLEAYKKYTK
jgi:guanosine-3',5'-bis(diphosphate) 3'-pyrophosphohydrolase